MAVVTWKSMTGPNFGPELAANANAIKLFRDSISNVGDSITKLGDDREKSVTEDFMQTLMAEDTIEGREALIAQADPSFLNLEKINKENYALGEDERTLNTQLDLEDRKQKADSLLYKRDVAYEDKLNERELAEDKTVLDARIAREAELLKTENARTDTLYANSLVDNKKLLDDDFERRQQALKDAAEIATNTALAKATSDKEKLEIKLQKENELKEKLDIAKKSQEFNLKELENIEENNKTYLKNLADEASALSGIYTKAAGGDKNYTSESLGYDQNDSNAFGVMRTAVLNRLKIDVNDRAAIADFDRFLAREITFNNNFGLLFDMNDFTFEKEGGGTVHFGFGQTGSVTGGSADEAKLLEEKYLISRVGPDIKRDLLSWYKEAEGGSTSRQKLDDDFAAYTRERPVINTASGEKEEMSATGFKTWLKEQFAINNSSQ